MAKQWVKDKIMENLPKNGLRLGKVSVNAASDEDVDDAIAELKTEGKVAESGAFLRPTT
jgi:hypothetical protein